MSSLEDVSVCLFRIASSYDSPKAMKKWFELGGFTRVKLGKDRILSRIYVWGNWKYKERGALFSSNLFEKLWLGLIVYNASFGINYSLDGKLISAYVSYGIL